MADAVQVAGDLSVALARDFGVFLADLDFHFHGVGELLFHLDAVEVVAGDLSVALARDFGVFLADPDFHLRHLFHGVGELLFHLDAVELASDLTVLYDLGEAPLHLDAVELSVCGFFFADPSFFLRYLLHGLGEMGLLRYLHHGLGEIGEISLHHDGVELASDLIVALTSDCFL